MSPDKRKKTPWSENLPGLRFWKVWRKEIPEITRYLSLPQKEVVSLKISFRGENDFLAIMKRYNDEQKVEVIFGSGPDFIGCLLGLEVAIDQDKWRLDRYAN